jgi:hypothetical protein
VNRYLELIAPHSALTQRQLVAWEKAELITVAETYSFFDLLKSEVRDLCAQGSSAVIRQSLQAMQKQVAGMENPLLEAGAYTTGHASPSATGKLLEPIAGQFLMDFAANEKVISRSVRSGRSWSKMTIRSFSRGIALEENPNTQGGAIVAYKKVLDLEPIIRPLASI